LAFLKDARAPSAVALRAVLAAGGFASVVLVAAAQSPVVDVSEGLVRVRPTGVALLDAASIERLKVGGLVRLDVSFAVLASRNGQQIAHRADAFRVSYDLWEERFAVTRLGPPARSASHPTGERLDAWCLAQLAIPVTELASLAPGAPFWIQLRYSAARPERRDTDDDPENFFLLSALIDRLSRRRSTESSPRTVEAGPFSLAP
jgi:hypothetical protein